MKLRNRNAPRTTVPIHGGVKDQEEPTMFRDRFLKPSWMRWAACAGDLGADIDFFSMRPADLTAAKALCNECAVQDLCADYAITEDMEYGVWGGIDQRERRKMIQELRRG